MEKKIYTIINPDNYQKSIRVSDSNDWGYVIAPKSRQQISLDASEKKYILTTYDNGIRITDYIPVFNNRNQKNRDLMIEKGIHTEDVRSVDSRANKERTSQREKSTPKEKQINKDQ